MTINISSTVYDKFNEGVDLFISEFGVSCKLVFHEGREECPHCVTNKNYYGGFSNFTNRDCLYCAGTGYRETKNEETIIMRVYPNKKKWLRIIDPVNVPDGSIQVIGYLSDLPKLRAADYIYVNTAIEGIMQQKFTTFGEFATHGFKRNRYFVGYLQRSV